MAFGLRKHHWQYLSNTEKASCNGSWKMFGAFEREY